MGSNSSQRKHLPFQDWPQIDQRAWNALFEVGDVFEDARRAGHWRPATRRTNRQHYARWLGHLALGGVIEPERDPDARVTRERVLAYAAHLTQTVAPRTAASNIIGLKVVMKAMAPETDWRWLIDLSNRLNTWAKPSVDRTRVMRPIDEIHSSARAELDRLLSTPLRRRLDRVAYRDTLIVLVLSACPVRLRNLSGLRIGTHLLQEGDRWAVRIPEDETKNAQRLNYLLPRHVGCYLAAYLGRVRPSFRPTASESALWLGFAGGTLCSHSIYCRIMLVTKRLFGMPINPHLFRSCGATTLVEQAPEAPRLAAPLLGHRYFQTTERYYVKAGQLVAGRRVSAALAALAAELDEGTDP
jgi:integrase